jgi:hypothetical protein
MADISIIGPLWGDLSEVSDNINMGIILIKVFLLLFITMRQLLSYAGIIVA